MKLKSTLLQTLAEVKEQFEELFDLEAPADAPPGGLPDPVHRRVLSIVYNPRVPSLGGRPLSEALGWNDPQSLTAQYIADARDCSYGYANFEVVETITVDDFPVKEDGFKYDAEGFVRAWRTRQGFHQPDRVDYHRILSDFDLIGRINSDAIDEVWLYAFPYAGFYESIMAGPGAFWCNAPPLTSIEQGSRRFIIMGYNYQRGVGEMLENLGHRAESILRHVFRRQEGDENLWERFARYDQTHPGRAGVGIMHFAPNSVKDYDWGNQTVVTSACDGWHNFPNLTGAARPVDCREWGEGNTRLHHLWWFRHLPHITGAQGGISFNWWEYIIDPNQVR